MRPNSAKNQFDIINEKISTVKKRAVSGEQINVEYEERNGSKPILKVHSHLQKIII